METLGISASDYGGNKKGLRKTNYSHRCRDCGVLRYTTAREWARAARPKCMACGGPLIETESSVVRQLGTKTQRKKKATFLVKADKKCYECGCLCLCPEELHRHLLNDGVCRKGYIGRHDGKSQYVVGTAYVERRKPRRYVVNAISADGFLKVITGFGTERDACIEAERINTCTAH